VGHFLHTLTIHISQNKHLLQYHAYPLAWTYNIHLSYCISLETSKTPSPQNLLLKGIFVTSKVSNFESKLKSMGATPGQQTSVDVRHAQSGAAEKLSTELVSPWSHSPLLLDAKPHPTL
jgi:hypothetical protein